MKADVTFKTTIAESHLLVDGLIELRHRQQYAITAAGGSEPKFRAAASRLLSVNELIKNITGHEPGPVSPLDKPLDLVREVILDLIMVSNSDDPDFDRHSASAAFISMMGDEDYDLAEVLRQVLPAGYKAEV